jgi:hypothetical protein
MSGLGSEQPLDEGDDPFPEKTDSKEATQESADKELDDVATGARVQVAISQLKSDRRNEQEEDQQRQEPTIAAIHQFQIVAAAANRVNALGERAVVMVTR